MRDRLREQQWAHVPLWGIPVTLVYAAARVSKAKVVSHRCYGFRTAKAYITALYHCLGDLPEPKVVDRFL